MGEFIQTKNNFISFIRKKTSTLNNMVFILPEFNYFKFSSKFEMPFKVLEIEAINKFLELI